MPNYKYRSKTANAIANGALALTIDQFCSLVPMSRTMYHALKRAGETPPEIQIGSARRISMSTAKAWIREREERGTKPSSPSE
jgi:predicted DNA-binding transcriptional regulator AlpA